MRRCWGKIGVALLLLIPLQGFSASFPPTTGWKTIKTEHFTIHFHQSNEPIAQKAAKILEEVYQKLTPKYQWHPFGRTQVILTDHQDDSNGLASVFPYHWLWLRIVPPRPEQALGYYDDWLQMLITHEYTHILHLDAARGFWRPFRWMFGKSSAPAGMTPGWIREGTATFEETVGTAGGRGRSSYSEMLIRTAILKNQFPPIDRAAGVHWEWPASDTQYLFGVEFLEYLGETYGAEKLYQFHKRTQSSPLLGAINHHAKKVYGKSFYRLWEEWQADLKQKYPGSVGPEPELFAGGKNSFALPTFAPDGKKLAYLSTNPHRAPRLIVRDLATGKEDIVAHRVPTQITFSPDGKRLAFAALASYKNSYAYYDLFELNLETKKIKRLTQGERARDPDYSPDGKRLIYAAGVGGGDALKSYDFETKKKTELVPNQPAYTQFAFPRFSSDGKYFVVSRFINGEGWNLALYYANGKFFKELTHQHLAIITRPAWGKNGNEIYYSSDEEGISDIYRYTLSSAQREKITQVKTGAFQPAISPDGKTLVVRYYNGKGFDLRKLSANQPSRIAPQKDAIFFGATQKNSMREFEKSPERVGGRNGLSQAPATAGDLIMTAPRRERFFGALPKKTASLRPPNREGDFLESRKYSPFGAPLFVPRYLAPGFQLLDNGLLGILQTGSFDPLRYHSWNGAATYRTDAKHLGYFGQYVYQRWRPVMGVGIADAAVDFGTLGFARTGNAYHYFEERRRGFAFLSYPFPGGHSVGMSYFYEDRLPITGILAAEEGDLNLGIYSGINTSYTFRRSQAYPASISPEEGRTLKVNFSITDKILGSNDRNEQRIFSGDWREFVSLGGNHVMAMRLAGGRAMGDRLFPRTFSLGGSLGEGILAGGGSPRYFSLRGLPLGTLTRDNVLVSSVEYRLPLVSPQRGAGTWPIFLNNVHLGFFTDAGDAWNDGETGQEKATLHGFFENFFLSTGAELRGDFVLGYGLPVTGRLGYGIIILNRDRLGSLEDPFLGNRVKNGILILQFGTSF